MVCKGAVDLNSGFHKKGGGQASVWGKNGWETERKGFLRGRQLRRLTGDKKKKTWGGGGGYVEM